MDLGPILELINGLGFAADQPELRRDGTVPVVRTAEVVVKLFPVTDRRDHDTELAAYRMLGASGALPVPDLVAHGRVGDRDYLVLSRSPGRPVLECSLTDRQRLDLAHRLGSVIKSVHRLSPILPVGRLRRDWLRDHGRGAARRHRTWGTLPEHLITQIDDYLVQPSERVLVHADLCVDHVFVDDDQLAGIIDWGGAEATDPHYELPVLHFGLFDADRRLLGAFLDGYGWRADDFVRRAMSATLSQEFDAFDLLGQVRPDLDLQTYPTLDDLADDLWQL
ncbi:phosphotransferase family protein [Microlunatus sp. GCM10028923]|uniref:phosphotransferase family protein n=1 Tax=Microlunatus sp. GCM10028923 TaxID=3273400 RepID=UPI00360B7BA4